MLCLFVPATALCGSAQLARAFSTSYPSAEGTAARAQGGDPSAVQDAYDAARELQEDVRAAAPVARDCRALSRSLARYAAGRVLEMEGVDRPSASDRSRGSRIAARARTGVASAVGACRSRGGGTRRGRVAMSPGPGEAFFGVVVARAPRGSNRAYLLIDRKRAGEVAVRGGRARFRVRAAAGPHLVRVVFTRGRITGAYNAPGAILLPPSARAARAGASTDVSRARSLGRALIGGPAYRAAWVQDLRTGAVASSNAGARFPAASTVKLGLLAGVLARTSGNAARSREGYDLKAMATWSSNLAANRLVRRHGIGAATDGLRRLGARSSTYTGEYIVGTELQPGLPGAGTGAQPPSVSARVTTAQDLARMLYGIHAAAVGAPGANRETGMSVTDARQALGWLLSSQQRGDNASLLASGARGAPLAQKNGWISSGRLGGGIAYGPSGPRIVVLATYDARGVSLGAAQALGARVARAGGAGG